MMKIGALSLKNNLFMAPMAGITDLAFRIVVRSFGASLCYSEMISANGLIRSTPRSFRYMESSSEDRPLAVQLFGSEPDILAKAAMIADESGADLIDINMGCPVKKVIRTGSGAFLMKDPQRVAAIVRALRHATSRPLTIKIRSGWSPASINAVEIARLAESEGADAVAVHPRTALQRYSGRADWGVIKDVKKAVSVPVIGSGDLWRPEDVTGMQDMTGCDAVMIARGSLGNPWIFQKALSSGSSGFSLSSPLPCEREETVRRHLELAITFRGEKMGMLNFRKHLLWYTKGLPGGARFRKSVMEVKDKKAILEALREFIYSGEPDAPGG
ncbi:MAG: tRNA dihydrouridine synthase DusB [Syntrophales bacterium]|nr:tRNA dihydrouridine synthase DusB [Syntrophales bacterium]